MTSSLDFMLSKLGLSQKARKLYEIMLGKGPMSVAEISMVSGLSYEEITESLNELKKVEIVREIPSVPPRYEAIPPYKIFLEQYSVLAESLSSFSESIKKVTEESLIDIEKKAGEFRDSVKKELQDGINRLTKSLDESLTKFMEESNSMVKDVYS